MITRLKSIFTAMAIMVGRVFTLSGKKKFLAVVGGFAAVLTAPEMVTLTAGQYSVFATFIAATVIAYLHAETTLDKRRIASTFLHSLLYNFKNSNFQVPAESVSIGTAISVVSDSPVSAELIKSADDALKQLR